MRHLKTEVDGIFEWACLLTLVMKGARSPDIMGIFATVWLVEPASALYLWFV